MYKINRLGHGGVIANYECNAACRHCLYSCSPSRTGGYITKVKADEVCGLLREGGCSSVHIGGGEPFLDFDGLVMLIQTLGKYGINVDYLETNAFWADDRDMIRKHLSELKKVGADAFCISNDGFHAEFVDPKHPALLAEVCQQTGFGYFMWRCDVNSVRYGGRAVHLEPKGGKGKSRNCDLLSVNHYHVDLYSNFVPPGCTGISIPLREALGGIPVGKYRVFEALMSGGVGALMKLASENNVVLSDMDKSACTVCFELRKGLSMVGGFGELDREFYEESVVY
jgi:hypothetical protein